MRTVELEKTIYRIGTLLQMAFGQLGAVIIRENASSGEGSLEIMIPGHQINAIFLVCRINYFTEIGRDHPCVTNTQWTRSKESR